MFENRFVAGVVAGLPVSLLCLGYLAVRRDAVVAMFTDGGGSDALSPQAAASLAVAAAIAVGPGLGLLAAVVWGWVPEAGTYLAMALILATLFSVAAVVTRTPMAAEKIVLNYAVALMLGFVAPRLAVG